MKLKTVTKIEKKKNKKTKKKKHYIVKKKLGDEVISANYDVIISFQFMAKLQPSGREMPDVWSINLYFH